MPRLTPEFKEAISSLSPEELLKIVLKFSKSNKQLHETLFYEYVNKKNPEELFDDTRSYIHSEISFPSRGTLEKQLAKSITRSVREINNFVKITKDKKAEADLLFYLLKLVFENYSNCFGTCWTVFDSKVGITINRLLNLIKNKLHYDYHVEYREELNGFVKD